MIKIIVADDEEPILKSIIRNIDWTALQLELLGTASNGKQVLEIMETRLPDILITDIAMPLMTGLELAKYIHENSLPVKVIFLSGHQEFDYARQGIRYNVNNYLLKPCEKNSLNQLLSQLIQECIKEQKEIMEKTIFEQELKKSRPALVWKFFWDLLSGNFSENISVMEKASFLGVDLTIPYHIIAAELDTDLSSMPNMEEKDRQYLFYHLEQAVKEYTSAQSPSYVLSISEDNYVLLLPGNCTKASVSVCCEQIKNTFFSFTGRSCTFSIGGKAENWNQFHTIYECAKEALLYKYMLGKNIIISYSDIAATISFENLTANTKRIQQEIIQAVKTGNSDLTEKHCETFFNTLHNCSPEYVKVILLQFISNLYPSLLEIGETFTELFGNENVVMEKVLHFDTIHDVKLWLSQLLRYISEDIHRKNRKSTHRIAEKAMDYIKSHFTEELTVERIADEVYLSPGYLMTIFKQETGFSVNSYIIRQRIEKAKELLLSEDFKIYEIAQDVGFSNTTFFSSTFKNYTGLSPRQYRELNIK